MPILAVLLIGVSTAAIGAQTPTATSQDGLVCTQVYDPNQVTVIHMERGSEITVELAPSEKIIKVSASDTAHLMYSILEGGNLLWLKPTEALPPQPLTLVAMREDGSSRIYLAQVDARPIEDAPRISEAALGSKPVLTDTQRPCYLVRYAYPADDAAKARAKAADDHKAQAAGWQAARNAALLRQNTIKNQNFKYVAVGDRNLAPDRIFDDGYSMFLEFDGNRSIPAPYEIGRDGKDKLVPGFTSEQSVCPGGTAPSATCLKLHTVAQRLRLRDQEDLGGSTPSLKIFNRAFDPVGNRPGTGTSNSLVEREVGK